MPLNCLVPSVNWYQVSFSRAPDCAPSLGSTPASLPIDEVDASGSNGACRTARGDPSQGQGDASMPRILGRIRQSRLGIETQSSRASGSGGRQTTRSTVAIFAWITSHTGVNDAFWNARIDAWLWASISAHDR